MNKRVIWYWATALALLAASLILAGTEWQGNAQLHTVMETVVATLALFIAVLALARYHTKRECLYLLIGMGFAGTGLLDVYHAVVTSEFFVHYMPSAPASLIPWSWTAGRVLLSSMMVIGLLVSIREGRSDGAPPMKPGQVYLVTGAFTAACFLFFALVPVPRAYFLEYFLPRPEELLPALLFLAALAGFVKRQNWRTGIFEHWLILSLIVGFFAQAGFMAHSIQLFDFNFDVAHVLKFISYGCVLAGLISSGYAIFVAEVANNERYTQVVANTAEGIVTIDEQGSIESINPVACRIFGYGASEMLGKNVSVLMAQDLRDQHHQYTEQSDLSAPRVIDQARDLEGLKKDGSLFPMELTVSPMTVNGEKKFVGILRDISERKNSEHELLEQKIWTEFALGTAKIGTWQWNVQDDTHYWDDHLKEMFGVRPKEYKGFMADDFARIIHPDDLDQVKAAMAAALDGVQEYNNDFRVVWPDGSSHWMNSRGEMKRDADGRPLLITGSCIAIDDRKIAEQARSESEYRFRRSFEDAAIGMTEISLDGDFIRVNRSLCDFLGYEGDQLLGMNVGVVTYPEDALETGAVRKKALAGDKSVPAQEKRYIRKDGQVVWGRVSRSLIKDETGKPLYFIGQIQDITREKHAEADRRLGEQRFQDFANSAGDRFWEMDQEFRYTYITDTPSSEARMPSDDMIGLARWEFSGIDANTQIWRDHRALLAANKPFRNFDYARVMPSGNETWIRTNGVPIFGDKGKFLGYRGTNADITDIKEAETAQQIFTDTIEAISESVYLYDQNDRYVTGNSNVEKEFSAFKDLLVPGTSADAIVEAIWEHLLHDDAKTDHQAYMTAILDFHDTPRSTVVQHQKDGRWIEIIRYRTADQGTLIIRTDISERVKQEGELRLAQAHAEAANRAKSEFLASMSHELRTPLNAILGFSQLLEHDPNEPISEVQLGYTRHVIKGGEHLLELIDQVLELSKIEAGQIDLTIENIEVHQVVEEGLEMVLARAENAGVTIENRMADADLPLVSTDRLRLLQALLNLMSNAVKYNRDGGSVTVRSEIADPEFLRVTVTGHGIPAEKQGGLFEPFNRLGREAGDIEGTGIGLTITSQIVELLGGRIGFESQEGVGSSFWIDIPIAEDQAPVLGAAEEPGLATVGPSVGKSSGTILYVEDNPANLELMKTIIERIPDVEMIAAGDAENAIGIARDQVPDLILMDINLPGMNGIEALHALRADQKTKRIPVLALTAAAMPGEIEKGKNAGFEEYLTKPIDVTHVLATISAYLDA